MHAARPNRQRGAGSARGVTDPGSLRGGGTFGKRKLLGFSDRWQATVGAGKFQAPLEKQALQSGAPLARASRFLESSEKPCALGALALRFARI